MSLLEDDHLHALRKNALKGSCVISSSVLRLSLGWLSSSFEAFQWKICHSTTVCFRNTHPWPSSSFLRDANHRCWVCYLLSIVLEANLEFCTWNLSASIACYGYIQKSFWPPSMSLSNVLLGWAWWCSWDLASKSATGRSVLLLLCLQLPFALSVGMTQGNFHNGFEGVRRGQVNVLILVLRDGRCLWAHQLLGIWVTLLE